MRLTFLSIAALIVLTSCAPSHTQEPENQGSPSSLESGESSPGPEPQFQTYDEAVEYVRSTYPGESIDTSRSSWITGAEYFEAGGRGYLIIGMQGKDYIFSGVPPEVWEGFKGAPSLGHYYNEEIRGRYHFDLESSNTEDNGADQGDDPTDRGE